MGCCANCCRSTCLALTSIISIGVIFAVLVVLTILISTQKIKEVSNTIYICFIVATVIAGIVLIFAIYASCCGKKCAKMILGTIFLVLGILLLIFGILVLAYKKNLKEFAYKLFIPGTEEFSKNAEARDILAKQFKCKYVGMPPFGWETDKWCYDVVTDKFDTYDLVCGIILIVFAVVMFIATTVAYIYSCKKSGVTNEP